jgi:hypothetical protein
MTVLKQRWDTQGDPGTGPKFIVHAQDKAVFVLGQTDGAIMIRVYAPHKGMSMVYQHVINNDDLGITED